ncbi:hypothetical protein CYMTET_45132, partial [Cymbomonas tetramitiformis]
ATSALDNESERIVQAALDSLVQKQRRTTLIIAHRLTTIHNAEKIAVVDKGRVVEEGTHDELMTITTGKYHALVQAATHVHEDEHDGELAEDEGSRALTVITGGPARTSLEIESGSPASRRISMHSDRPATPTRKSLELAQIGIEAVGDAEGEKTDKQRAEDAVAKKAVEKAEKKEEALRAKRNVSRVWSYYEPRDYPYMLFGTLGAVVSGGGNPAMGIVFVKSIAFFYFDDDDEVRKDSHFWCVAMILMSLAGIAGETARHWGFGVVGGRLTRRLRYEMYEALLKQEIGWFDLPENGAGLLASHLAEDVSCVQALSGEQLGRNVLCMGTVVVGFTLAFSFGSPELSGVALACVPLMTTGMALEMAVMSGEGVGAKDEGVGVRASQLIGEIVTSPRTVASFVLESHFTELFSKTLDEHLAVAVSRGVLKGFFTGFSQVCMFVTLAFLYWWGGSMVADGEINFEEMTIPIFCIFMMAAGFGMAAQGATDMGKAAAAADRVFAILDRKSTVDPTASEGAIIQSLKGKINFQSVVFTYPTRTLPICRGFTLEVPAGKTVALVGQSGCGKSTSIQLIQRFYDPQSGSVTLDDVDLLSINVKWLRSQIGLVGQEPVLFAGSVTENVTYGKMDATQEDVVNACKQANAHAFVEAFPQGYNTHVGTGGNQLSGGQKQRVAIARTLVKNPSIMLLDEATSALDNESERVVQAALDDLLTSHQRTTLVIAHRLTTIENADIIVVVHEGRVKEQGTHNELMQRNGRYAQLQKQSTM